MTTMEEAVKTARIYVTSTGCSGILRAEHFNAMLEDSIVCNIGHFDCEIDVDWLNKNCVDKSVVQPQVWEMAAYAALIVYCHSVPANHSRV